MMFDVTRETVLLRARVLLRPVLWGLTLGLAALILTYPVRLRLGPFIVTAPDIFPNLPLFAVLFYLWMASLVVLVVTPSNEVAATWERLILVAVAALVLRGFWNIIAPVQHQSLAHAGATKIWLGAGHIVPPGAYINWPGLSVATSLISQITGTQIFPSAVIQTLFVTVIIASTAYISLLGVLKTSLPAALSCLLVLEGSQWLHITYNPGPMALAFVLSFLMVILRHSDRGDRSSAIVVLLFVMATTFTQAFGAALIFWILASVWVLTTVRRHPAGPAVPIASFIFLSLVIPVGWLFYWGGDAFAFLVGSAFTEWVNFSPTSFLGSGLDRSQAQFWEALPLWVRGPRLFWFALLYASGALLWLRSLAGIRRFDPARVRFVAAYSGLAALTVVTALSLTGGTAELRRSLTYGSFLGVPLAFMVIQHCKPLVARLALSGMVALLLLLSFPSFLGNALGVPTWTFYDSEYAVGTWAQSMYGSGKGLNIFATNYDVMPVMFYLPKANYTSDRQVYAYASMDEEGVWQSMDEFYDKFGRFSRSDRTAIFVSSPKMALYTASLFGIPPTHPRWRQMIAALSAHSHRIYDNGTLVVHESAVP